MAIQDFIYKIGADVTQFTKSISEVDGKLKELRNSLKNQTGKALIDTNKQIKLLEQSLINLKQVGLDKLPKATADATVALNSLNQVARDLPFGFIAIQNNLPIVADSFQKLIKDSNGVGPALKNVAASLAGPAGLSFAIGATISGITALVQKYGTLGNALSNILGLTKTSADVQKQLNDNINSASGATKVEVTELTLLANALTDANITSEKRNSLIGLANKDYPALLANINAEKLSTDELKKAVAERLKLLVLQIQLNARQKFIEDALAKSYDEQYETLKDFGKLNPYEILSKSLKGFVDNIKNGNFSLDAGKLLLDGYNIQLSNSKTEIDTLNTLLETNTNELNDLNAAIEKAIKDGKKKSDLDKEAIRNAQEYAKFLEERIALEEKLEIQRLKGIRTTSIQLGKDTKANLIKYGKLETKIKPLEFFDINDYQQAVKRFEDKIKENPPKPSIDIVPTEIVDTPAIQKAKKELSSLFSPEDFAQTYNAIANVFFNPIQDLFDNFIQTGKFAFKEFGKAVLAAISQIVAKVIATGIITLLASIFTGGLGPGGAVAKAGGFGKILLGALGIGGNVASPSFGGVNPGGMAMAGSVNLVLRGQDLVGSINRTNSQLSRIG
jgi:hypothetical protein